MNLLRPGMYFRIVAAIYFKRLLSKLPFLKSHKPDTFIILGRARTGSTLLHTYLNSHPQLISLDEILHPVNNKTRIGNKPALLLEHQIQLKSSKVIQATGFKFFYDWADFDSLKKLFTDFKATNSIKIIHLKRKNHLRTLVSFKIAEKNKEWSKGKSANRQVNKQVFLSPEVCISAFTEMEKEENSFDMHFKNHPVLELFYENLAKNPDKELLLVQQFLNVKPLKLVTLLKRQNPEKLHALIGNYQELKSHFLNTKWALFFED